MMLPTSLVLETLPTGPATPVRPSVLLGQLCGPLSLLFGFGYWCVQLQVWAVSLMAPYDGLVVRLPIGGHGQASFVWGMLWLAWLSFLWW